MFKDKHIQFQREIEEDFYRYEFPGHNLSMTVQPHWVQWEPTAKPITKVTLRELTAENTPFAEMLAESIDKMTEQRQAFIA